MGGGGDVLEENIGTSHSSCLSESSRLLHHVCWICCLATDPTDHGLDPLKLPVKIKFPF